MGAGVARRVNAGLTVERVHHQAGIVGDGRQAVAATAASALMIAFSTNVVPFSSGSSKSPSWPSATNRTSGKTWLKIASISAQLMRVARGDHDGAFGVQCLDVDLLKLP